MFSTSGFTPGAVSVAESQGIALFTFDAYGTAPPKTTHARSLAPDTQPDPPFAPKTEDPEPTRSDTNLGGQGRPVQSKPVPQGRMPEPDPTRADEYVDTDEWSECPTCGTTHFKNARFCRSCGTELETGRPHGHTVALDGTPLVCTFCGGTNIALVTDDAER
jgi:hypothetical protein